MRSERKGDEDTDVSAQSGLLARLLSCDVVADDGDLVGRIQRLGEAYEQAAQMLEGVSAASDDLRGHVGTHRARARLYGQVGRLLGKPPMSAEMLPQERRHAELLRKKQRGTNGEPPAPEPQDSSASRAADAAGAPPAGAQAFFDPAAAQGVAAEATRAFSEGLADLVSQAAARISADAAGVAQERASLAQQAKELAEQARELAEQRAQLEEQRALLEEVRQGLDRSVASAAARVLVDAPPPPAPSCPSEESGVSVASNPSLTSLHSAAGGGLAPPPEQEEEHGGDRETASAEPHRVEDEHSEVQAAIFQCSCTLADLRGYREGGALDAVGPMGSQSPHARGGRIDKVGIATSTGTSGRSTPVRPHMDYGKGSRPKSDDVSPETAKMAIAAARRALAAARRQCGARSPEALRAASELALQLEELGEATEEAGSLLRDVLEGFDEQLGPDHLDSLRAAHNTAVFLDNNGQVSDALPLYRRAADGRRRQLGPEHPDTLDSSYNLALFLQNTGELAEAEGLLREALAGCRRTFGEQHRSTLDCMERLVEVLVQARSEAAAGGASHVGSSDELVALCHRLLEGREVNQNRGHPDALRASLLLLDALTIGSNPQDANEEAQQVHRDCMLRHEEALGLGDPVTLELTFSLAGSLASCGETGRAEEVLRNGRQAAAQALGPTSPAALSYDDELAVLLANTGRAAAAESLFRTALVARRGSLGPQHEDTLRSAHNLAVLLDSVGRREEAGKAYREVWSGRTQALGEEHPKTVEATYNLAVFLDGRSREGPAAERPKAAAEAEQLFEAARQQLEAQFGVGDERARACAERVKALRGGKR